MSVNLPSKPPLPPSIIAAIVSAGLALGRFLLGFIRRKRVDKASDEEAALGAAEDVLEELPNVVKLPEKPSK